MKGGNVDDDDGCVCVFACEATGYNVYTFTFQAIFYALSSSVVFFMWPLATQKPSKRQMCEADSYKLTNYIIL